jgi:DNA replication and repair protein RecF
VRQVHVSQLVLTDFRSYPQLELDMPAGVVAFVGPNGQGKTNLLEALGYLASLSSHRVALDAPLVRAGAARAVLRARVRREDRELLVELELNPGKANRARLGRAPVPRPREIIGVLRTVLFAPEDLALVKGDPDGRRRFLDELLTVRSPRFAAVRADYDRVLRQRNTLLRSAAAARRATPAGDLRTLDTWDSHLARHGADLLAGRRALLTALRPLVLDAHARVVPEGREAGLGYRASLGTQDPGDDADRTELEAALLAGLAAARPQEIERGVTLVGPHRDDMAIDLGGMPARGYASHGECWSLAVALRLASYDLLREDGADPVLLLDDVFAELDGSRRRRLAELVAPAEQVLVTAAVPDDVPGELAGARYDVMAGRVTRVR